MMPRRAGRRFLATTVIAALVAWAGLGRAAAELRTLELTTSRPPCSPAAGLPIVPDDPAAVTDSSGVRRCYGTRPPVLTLRIPLGHWLWLRGSDTSPAAWIAVGPVLVDPDELETPAVGLRLSDAGDGLVLESRYADQGTLAPLRPGEWQPLRLANGRRFWVRVGGTAGQ